jgi:iron complex outermembrane receptor protein
MDKLLLGALLKFKNTKIFSPPTLKCMYSTVRLSKIIRASACLLFWAGLSVAPSHAFSEDIDKEIFFKRKAPFSIVASVVQPISGTVTDETGAPLPGATVLIKGTTTGTATNSEGKFVIDADADAILVISYVGYALKEVSVNGQSAIVVQLDPDLSQLNEVVVVGYGTQKRSDVTGAISSISSESFNRGVVTNPGELLQGKLAGVSIAANSGEPGLPKISSSGVSAVCVPERSRFTWSMDFC